jgi:alkanesulfonate monooxygenase SsuD/methylene tetrahydromethanopterin reductase-like flavin-dependent oxidoreductase (luciferase family)
MAGRGSFIESFPLFGYDLDDYDSLFAEKLDLLLQIRDQVPLTWSGRHRAPLVAAAIHPRALQTTLPIWVAVGGTPQSVVRAGALGLPLAVAIIGGLPEHFAPLLKLYRDSGARAGHPEASLPVGINCHGYIAETATAARAEFFPPYAQTMTRIGRERGWPPTTRAQFDMSCGPRGALMVGGPDEVIDKILAQYALFGHRRLLLQMSVGTMAHDKMLRSIELFGTKVAPVIRREIAARRAQEAGPPLRLPAD